MQFLLQFNVEFFILVTDKNITVNQNNCGEKG